MWCHPISFKLSQLLITVTLLLRLAAAGLDGHCPPLGPVLPAPTSPSSDAAVNLAVSLFSSRFAGITSPFVDSAVSISVRSIHEDTNLLDLHYTPPNRGANSTAVVDGDTVFRVGSISKVFTVLGVLKHGIAFDDPVTKYLPELAELGSADGVDNDVTAVSWGDITIGALASHMSGIGNDLIQDLANKPQPWTSVGFPAITNTSEVPGCQGLYGLPPCPESEFYRDFGKHPPVYAPFTTPMYSNLGVSILGMVLERASSMTYADYIQEQILTPLALDNTATSAPSPPANAFIPAQATEEDWWDVDLGWDVPAGGLYSTSNDLVTLGAAILNGNVLGSAATRKWLKPVSSTSTVGRAMGAPWEILRSTNLTVDNRLIEIYTKSGDAGTYHSKLALIPDYDVAVSILSGGPEADFTLSFSLLSQLLAALLPALEQAGKDQANALGFTGTFRDVGSNSSLTLALDAGPGLAVTGWTARGHDVAALYASDAVAGLGAGAGATVRPRLYPANLRAVGGAQTEWAWRAVFDAGTAADAAAFDAGFAWEGQSCQTWAGMDRFPYAFRGIDEFAFVLGSEGGERVVQTLWSLGFAVGMERAAH